MASIDTIDTRQTVKVLAKGLTILAELNRNNGLSILELSERLHLPRPTVARITATLEQGGYVYRCAGDRRYRVDAKVRSLSNGYSASNWLKASAAPVADRLASALGWPAMVAQFEERRLRLVYLTDRQSSVLVERSTLGDEIPLLGTALGHCYLAFSSDAPIEDVLRAGASGGADAQACKIEKLESHLEHSRAQGHAVFSRPGRTAVAAPIFYGERAVAAIGVRIPVSTERLVPQIEDICRAVREAAKAVKDALAES